MNTFLNSDLRLVKSSVELEVVAIGQPAFFQYWANAVDVLVEPTIFVYETFCRNGGTPSRNTWAAAAYDLLTWFQWCQAKGINWCDSTEADRRQFCDDYKGSISPSGENYSESSINRKLTIVRRFYEFAAMEGWYRRDMGDSLYEVGLVSRPIDSDALAHTRASHSRDVLRDPLLLKVGRKDVIRPLQVRQLRKLLAHLCPTDYDVGGGFPMRDRLIADLGWVCGARLGDVTGLTTLKFLSISVEPLEQLKNFELIVQGKGKVTRKVAAPGWLVLAIQAYIQGERARSEQVGKKRGVKRSTALFLGHANSKGAGQPLTC